MTSPVYDLDRAARAAGIDPRLGVTIAAEVLATARRITATGDKSAGLVEAALPGVARAAGVLGDDPVWTAAMADALKAMVLDLRAQAHEGATS